MKSLAAIFLILILTAISAFSQLTTENAVFEEYDIDGDEVIDRLEFGMSPLAVEARSAGREEVLGETFDKLDQNLDNAIGREEFDPRVLRGWKENPGAAIFKRADANNDGFLDQREYLRASGQSEISLAEPFAGADLDGNGKVDPNEWDGVLALSVSNPQAHEDDYFLRMDRNRDGSVTFSEFSRSPFGDRVKRRGGKDFVLVMFDRIDLDG
ncbi:MAG: EF-hand domain-containing protein, partial [Verrucomicrobiota bacterium]